jgi:hypothetical protein
LYDYFEKAAGFHEFSLVRELFVGWRAILKVVALSPWHTRDSPAAAGRLDHHRS